MNFKEQNEITVRVICPDEELIRNIKEKGFSEVSKFTLDDYYLIPNSLDINTLSVREILSKAIIIRYIVDSGNVIQKITFKIKDINECGEIINQKSINCNILDKDEARNLFKVLGYNEIMNIKENDIIYSKDNFELTIKFIKNSNTLIEIETDGEFDNIDKLKKKITEIDLPIEKNNFFVKKAEDELSKILKRINN